MLTDNETTTTNREHKITVTVAIMKTQYMLER